MPFRSTFTLAILLSTLVFAAGGCAASDDKPEQPALDVTHFEAEGRVIRILENTRLLQIHHGDIDGFMPAMTMPFEYREDAIRQALSVGDSVHFTIATNGVDNWVTAVRVIR